jgi:hypothetical protein
MGMVSVHFQEKFIYRLHNSRLRVESLWMENRNYGRITCKKIKKREFLAKLGQKLPFGA